MTIALCAVGNDRKVIHETLLEWAEETGRGLSLEVYGGRESLLRGMKTGCFDAVFVALPGVAGMEAAIGVRGQNPCVPLVWVSDEKLLAIQSYRLRASLFLLSPVEPEQVLDGLERCGLKEAGTARCPPHSPGGTAFFTGGVLPCGREKAEGSGTAIK